MAATVTHTTFKGLPALHLRSAGGAAALVSLHGAQVLSWQPTRGDERLYLSPRARFDGFAIRGGIPLCFPQFGDRGALPAHGFARTRAWRVCTERSGDDFALVSLELEADADSLALWPHAFRAELTVLIEGSRLDIELEVENTGAEPFEFTGALHTYLAVREVEETRIEGLHGHSYEDRTQAGKLMRDSGDVLLIDDETDRIYRKVTRPLLVREAGRCLGVHAQGFADVVVWNPWEERSRALADLPDDGFRRMLCMEAAAAHQAVQVDAGTVWHGRQTLVAL